MKMETRESDRVLPVKNSKLAVPSSGTQISFASKIMKPNIPTQKLLPLLAAALCFMASLDTKAAPLPVKVFILAGQSNMEGQAVADLTGRDYNDGKGTLATLLSDPTKAALFKHLKTVDGQWAVRDDVWVRYQRENRPLLAGPLGLGFSVYGDKHHFGPELQFGHVVGDNLDNPVLLIKTAWGGKSLYKDFRPPLSGGEVGKYYTLMIAQVREALANLDTEIPALKGRGYELAGLVWYQGWNDGVDPKNAVPEYEQNLVNLIHNVRGDLQSPKLPVIIGELTGPWVQASGSWDALRKAQAAVARRPEFAGNVIFVPTHDFVRKPEDSPNPTHGHHEFGNAETYFLVGDALGKGMMQLLSGKTTTLAAEVQKGEMAGYLLVSSEKVPDEYNAGFSLYAAAWPLLQQYPGNRFQTGLFGTWMHPQYEGKAPEKLYTDIEGGLGWWRDTRFATETPKFIMGGVAVNFSAWANGPGAGKGRDWNKPQGKYGIASLSPWVLWPPDGLNLKQGTSGELFGYGYLPLPLTEAKPTTNGKPVPTGDQSWTLFLNTANFKGPVCFFTPYFWSQSAELNPDYAGLLLDSRPSAPNKPFQMETQYVPAALSADEKGQTFARVAPTSFPVGPDGNTVVLHRLTSYKKSALWDGAKAWFAGGAPVSGINPDGAYVQTFRPNGGSTWKIYTEKTPKEQKVAMDWKSFATPIAPDPTTYGYKWNEQLTSKVDAPNGSRVVLPEYFQLKNDGKKDQWIAAKPTEVPATAGLTELKFDRPQEKPHPPYETPEAPDSSFKRPGPVAGPFKAHLGDGSVVTYYWYRFADQPALLNADLTKEEREKMQAKVEKMHRVWTKDRDYLAPPTIGKLADLDAALIVTPPKGFEIGYVPIATRQEFDTSRSVK